MIDERHIQDIRDSLALYEGRTAKDRWLSAQAAFLQLRYRVLAKWEGELHRERSEDSDYWLCYYLRNLAFQNDTRMLELNPPDEWDGVMETCAQLGEWYARELCEFRILALRIYSTFAPTRARLTPKQREQLFRCYWYFDTGEDLSGICRKF